MGVSENLLEYMRVWAVLLAPFLCLAAILVAALLVTLYQLNAYLQMRMGRKARR